MLLWDPSLAVGVPSIDAQHQELFRRVNALLAAMHRGASGPESGRLLDFLATYVVEHFADEERLMTRHAFPGAVEHRQAHADFARQVAGLRQRLEAEGAGCGLSTATNRLVCGWVRAHTGGADVALGRHLLAVGAVLDRPLRSGPADGAAPR